MTSRMKLNFLGIIISVMAICCFQAFSNAAVPVMKAQLQKVNIQPLPGNKLRIQFLFDKKLPVIPPHFQTKTPPAIIFDLNGASSVLPHGWGERAVNEGVLNQFRVVQSGSRLRLVLNLQESVQFDVSLVGKSLVVILAGSSAITTEAARKEFPHPVFPAPLHSLCGIDFKSEDGKTGKLKIDLSDSNVAADIKTAENEIRILFLDTNLPQRLRHRYNVSAFGTAVLSVHAMPRGRNTLVVLETEGDFKQTAYQIDKHMVVEVKSLTMEESSTRSSGKKVYKGKRMSLDFQDIKVRAVLQLIAEFTGLNMVISDSVEGNMTLRLQNVPWDEALDIILRTRGLDKREFGGVLMIAPAKEIALQEKQDLTAKMEVELLTPLSAELMQLNYAKATDIAVLLKDKETSILSPRGAVSVDERTNTLWIQDTAQKLNEVRVFIQKLDVPVRQVLIEARIVMVNKNFEREIGVRFGMTRPTDLSGTLGGANQMKQGVAPADIDPFTRRLNVDLPTTFATGERAASIGLALAKLGSDVLLDLELSALEVEGNGEVISSPRVITANQQPALIESGKEIPYQETTSSGATSVSFKKAVLSLNVTPQVTPDNRIILSLVVNQDTATNEVVLGVPVIDTKEIQTNVLVNNGETVVLGGIYKQTKSHDIQRVPFLGRMPIIGALFRNKNEIDDREELLIFVTPKIIEQKYKGYA